MQHWTGLDRRAMHTSSKYHLEQPKPHLQCSNLLRLSTKKMLTLLKWMPQLHWLLFLHSMSARIQFRLHLLPVHWNLRRWEKVYPALWRWKQQQWRWVLSWLQNWGWMDLLRRIAKLQRYLLSDSSKSTHLHCNWAIASLW